MNPVVNRRTALSMTFASVAGLVVAGCSSSSSDQADPSQSGSNTEPGAFPVTIDHKLGSTTIESPPSRIAAVGIGDADVLLSLGLTPVLVPVWNGSTDDGIGIWAEPTVTGDEPVALENATTEFDVEKIAAAAPDLIIAVNNAIDDQLYAQLSAIAPTVLHAADQTDWVLPWQEVSTRIGRSVGLAGAAAAEVARVETLVTQARADNPHFVGKTAALVIRWSDGKLRAFAPESARFQLLSALGFEPPAALADLFDGKLNTELSAETYSLLECDYLFFDNYDRVREAMEAQPTFTSLGVVRNGGLIRLDPIVSDAVSMPNPLTIPFVLSAFIDDINAVDAAR